MQSWPCLIFPILYIFIVLYLYVLCFIIFSKHTQTSPIHISYYTLFWTNGFSTSEGSTKMIQRTLNFPSLTKFLLQPGYLSSLKVINVLLSRTSFVFFHTFLSSCTQKTIHVFSSFSIFHILGAFTITEIIFICYKRHINQQKCMFFLLNKLVDRNFNVK
jgi:hypothetical protein